jgi:hypothetical protein
MRQRNAIDKQGGKVQIDDAYLGGDKPGKVGRGAANKVPFVIAVATRKNEPISTQLRCISGFSNEAIKAYGQTNIAPGSRVLSDGLLRRHRRRGAEAQGCPDRQRFKWTNTGQGNIKSAIAGDARATRSLPSVISPLTRGASIAASSATKTSSALRASLRRLRPLATNRSPQSKRQRRYRGNRENLSRDLNHIPM